MSERPVIAVRTDVARELLLDRLFDAVMAKLEQDPPPDGLADGVPVQLTADANLDLRAALRLAHAGYLSRIVEVQSFPAAAVPVPWLSGLTARTPPADVAEQLASEEPAGRPDPGEGAPPSWRVPGPGGHIRHYLALRATRVTIDDEESASALIEAGTAKRCWMFGFYLRCAEEVAASTR